MQPGWWVSCYCQFIDSNIAVSRSRRHDDNVVYVVFLAFAQQRIDRTRHLVCHRHCGNVGTAPVHQFFGPATGMILFVVDIPQYRTGTVDEKSTQIHISTLADPQQGGLASRGVLSRYQSKKCG